MCGTRAVFKNTQGFFLAFCVKDRHQGLLW